MTDTFERLQSILIRDYKLEAQALTFDAPLEGLGIDSLGVAELLFTIEDEFAINIPADPVLLPTLGDVVSFIDGLLQNQPGTEVTASAIAKPVLMAS